MDNVIVIDKIEELGNGTNERIVDLNNYISNVINSQLKQIQNDISNLTSNQHWYVTIEPSNNFIANLTAGVNKTSEIFIPIPGNYRVETSNYGTLYKTSSEVTVVNKNSTANVHLGIGTYCASGGKDYSSGVYFYGDLVIKNYDNANLSEFFQ